MAESSPSHSEVPLRGLVARLRICVCVSMCVYVCVGEGRGEGGKRQCFHNVPWLPVLEMIMATI